MGEVTVKIPADYSEAFRDAVLAEVSINARYAMDSTEELQLWILTDRAKRLEAKRKGTEAPEPQDINPEDIASSVRYVRENYALLQQALGAEEEITGHPDVLQHTFQTMADKVLAPKLAEEVNYSPIEDRNVARITAVTAAIEWAIRESARMYELWLADRAEVV